MRPPSATTLRVVRLYSILAWIVIGWIVVGFVLSIPAVEAMLEVIEASALGRAALGIIVAAGGISLVGLWAVAIWYARVSDEVIARGTLTVMLIWTNFVGALFYYWIVVHRRVERRLAFRPVAAATVSPPGA